MATLKKASLAAPRRSSFFSAALGECNFAEFPRISSSAVHLPLVPGLLGRGPARCADNDRAAVAAVLAAWGLLVTACGMFVARSFTTTLSLPSE